MADHRIAVIERAAASFSQGDDEGFVACFHPRAQVFLQAQPGTTPAVSGHEALRAWCDGERSRWGEARIAVRDASESDAGLVADLLVIGTGDTNGSGWRFAIAVRFEDGLVSEVRPFAQRDAAFALLNPS